MAALISRVRKALAEVGIKRRNYEGPILNPHTSNFVRLDWEPPGHEPPCYPQPAEWMEENERLTQEGLARCARILRAAGFAVIRGSAALIVSERVMPFGEPAEDDPRYPSDWEDPDPAREAS